ncbi:MAG: peptidase [Candidatus Nitrosotenuis sp.]|nr:MAG: peptidase [Candidatus Nitrosotenuis sp.]
MNMRGLLCGTITALALMFVPFPASASERCSPAEAAALVKQGIIIPMKAVVAKAEKLKAGRLLEADLRKKRGVYVYDVDILDAAGIVWELKFNAATGELLGMEEEKD